MLIHTSDDAHGTKASAPATTPLPTVLGHVGAGLLCELRGACACVLCVQSASPAALDLKAKLEDLLSLRNRHSAEKVRAPACAHSYRAGRVECNINTCMHACMRVVGGWGLGACPMRAAHARGCSRDVLHRSARACPLWPRACTTSMAVLHALRCASLLTCPGWPRACHGCGAGVRVQILRAWSGAGSSSSVTEAKAAIAALLTEFCSSLDAEEARACLHKLAVRETAAAPCTMHHAPWPCGMIANTVALSFPPSTLMVAASGLCKLPARGKPPFCMCECTRLPNLHSGQYPWACGPSTSILPP